MHTLLRACALALVLAPAAGAANAEANAAPPLEASLGDSVASLLAYAKKHNPEYAAFQYEATAASERAASAGTLADPRLRIELQDISRVDPQSPTLAPGRVGSTRYTLMQDVPWFGKRALRRDIAAQDADGASARAVGSWADIAARIKASYAQYYAIDQSRRLSAEILDLVATLEQVTQARYAGAMATQSDVIRAQVELGTLKNELVAIENEQRTIQARLNLLLARPADAVLAAPERPRALPEPARLELATLQERLSQHNAQLFTEAARVKAAEKSRELSYKNRYPDFTFGIAPIQAGNTIKEWEVMVELNIPLQQAPRRAQEREAEAMLSAAHARHDVTANQIQAELAEDLFALDAARRTGASIENSLLPQAELTYKAALAGYENGKLDFTTLLDAQRQIRQAKQTRIRTQAEAQVRLADIERLIGEDL